VVIKNNIKKLAQSLYIDTKDHKFVTPVNLTFA